MTVQGYPDSSTWPKVLVVGDPRLGDILASSGARWVVQPVAPTITAMWDAVEAGSLHSDAAVCIVTDGTGMQPDELESTLAAFAPFSTTFLLADPSRCDPIIARARALATEVAGGDPSAPIWPLPVHDVQEALDVMRRILGDTVVWDVIPAPATPAAPPARPVAPPPQAPAAQPIQHQFGVAPEAPPVSSPEAALPHPEPTGYEQAQYYAPEVAAQATRGIPKRPDAIPGQITISCMSSKGGSGKSTTALMLAATIAKCSAAAGDPKRVVVVDLDTRDGQVGSLIGQYMPTSINIRVLPRWDAAAVKRNLVHDKRLGIDALLAPVRPRNADDVGPDFYREIIGVLQTTHDVVILDCSVNYLDALLGTAFAMSDEILFVTTLATTAVQGMARSLNELFADTADGGLGIPREKVGVVANQVINNVGMGKDKLLRAVLGCPLVGQIPSDQDAVLIATNSNRMFDLLKHPTLGPAYFRLAKNCLPNTPLQPVTVNQTAVTAQPQQSDPSKKKKGLFGR